MASSSAIESCKAWDKLREGLCHDRLSIQEANHLMKFAKGLVRSRADEQGMTLLHYAAFHHNSEICELLILEGADINAKNKWGQGQNPLDRALMENENKKPSDDLIALLSGKRPPNASSLNASPPAEDPPVASPPAGSTPAGSPPAGSPPGSAAFKSGGASLQQQQRRQKQQQQQQQQGEKAARKAMEVIAREKAERKKAAREEAERKAKFSARTVLEKYFHNHKFTNALGSAVTDFESALRGLEGCGCGEIDLARSLRNKIIMAQKVKDAHELIDTYITTSERNQSPITPSTNSRLDEALGLLEEYGVNENLPKFKKGLGDEKFLEMMKNAVNSKLLEKLSHYPIKVSRNNITDDKLRGVGADHSTGVTLDLCDGVCCTRSDGNNEIIVRSTVADGYVLLDHGTLLHEIGHAFDYLAAHQTAMSTVGLRGTNPLHATADMIAAISAEKSQLASYFHDAAEFVAETFARYALDRGRMKKKFPKACAVFDKEIKRLKILDNPEEEQLVNAELLDFTIQQMLPPPPVTTIDDAWETLERQNLNNNRSEEDGRSRNRFAMGLITSDDVASARMVGRDLSRRLFYQRSKRGRSNTIFNPSKSRRSTFGIEDAFKEVDLSSTTLNEEIFHKNFDHHALIILSPAKGVTSSSKGLQDMIEFLQKTRDICVPVFYGSENDLKAVDQALKECIPDNRRGFDPVELLSPCKINLPNPRQITTQIEREANAEGYYLSREAKATVLSSVMTQGLSLSNVKSMTSEIRLVQKKRTDALPFDKDDKSSYYVLRCDICTALESMKSKESDPFDDLEKMIGLKEVKEYVGNLQDRIDEIELLEEEGETGDQVEGIRLLFLGNPGTGKTVVASIFARILSKLNFTKSENPWTVDDVVPAMQIKGEADMTNLFKKFKDSIIFIDEFQDMHSTDDGKKALKALNPLLSSPEYQGTVFIGAGYEKEVNAMLADENIQPGLVRRLNEKVMFSDFTRDELEQIWNMKCAKKGLEMEQKVIDAAIDRVLKQQRAEIHPSNGGMVQSVLNKAVDAKTTRIRPLSRSNREEWKEARKHLVLEDVLAPPSETLDEVWAAINEFAGLDDLKKMLREIQDYEEAERDLGRTPTETYNFILQGPAGTGKSTIAEKIIGRFFAALDIIPYPKVVKKKGTELQAEYVGQTGPKIEKMFKEAWGRTLFIDEISAVVGLGASFGGEALKGMLTYLQDEEYRRKFVVCIADYEENIKKIFKADEGIERRFSYVVTIPRWDAETSLKCLNKVYLDKYEEDLSGFEEILQSELSTIVKSEKYASGGTICDVLSPKIKKRANSNKPSRKVTEEIIREVFNEVRPNYPLPSDHNRPPTPPPSNPPPRPRVACQVIPEEREEQKEQAGSDRGKKIMKAIETVNGMFADLANSDPDAFKAAQDDLNSNYNKELAKQLTVDLGKDVNPEQAKKVRIKVAKIKQEKFKTIETEQIQRFQYHCPFCGGIDAVACFYINYPLEWKIEHSLKPPWTESIEKEVEKEVDVLVYEEVVV